MAGDLSRIGNLNKSLSDLQGALKKVSSGKRINTAADDAAGLAIADSFAASVTITDQARRNISDASSALQIADGALGRISQIGERLSELAAQPANGTLSDGQRTALNNEFTQLTQEAQRIAATTQFNGKSLLSGGSQTVQVGSDSQSSSQINLAGGNASGITAALSSLDISNSTNAKDALDRVSSFISSVAEERGSIGAVGSRLEAASNNASGKIENESAAESRIRDADIAESSAQLAAARIRTEVNASLGAHGSGPTRDVVLKLLG